MPPKKSKTQANASSSQPAPALQPTRVSGRKRRHSDASNASDRPSSSHSVSAATPSKRAKRGKAAAEPQPEMIVEETEEVIEEIETVVPEQPSMGPACDAVGGAESITVSKHVHFGGATEEELEDEDYEMEKTTATHITPHPRKMGVKRRTTASPNLALDVVAGDGVIKRVKRTSTRHSLPSALSGEDGQSVYYVAEHDYAPLSEVLRERIERRKHQHAERQDRILALEVELDQAQQKNNRRRVKELEGDLLALREEQKLAMETKVLVDSELLDKDMLVLEHQEEIAYPDLPTEFDVETTHRTSSEEVHVRRSSGLRESRSSAIEAADARWEVERQKFGDALVSLSKEANDAKAKLQVLEIELQGLGLHDGGFNAKDVLVSIRESFSRVRESLSQALPDSIPEGASNQDLIQILVTSVEDFSARLRLQDRELFDKEVVITDLSKQVQGLLDHLAEAEIRKQTLQERWNELDAANESKDRDMEDLQEDVDAVVQERDALQIALDAATEKIKELTQENVDFAASMHRLNESLLNYQKEETRLTLIITKMEEEHATDIAQMNREREEIIRDSDVRFNEQTTLRENAEQLAEERQSMIASLQLRIELIEAERESTRRDLEHMTSLRDEEHDARDNVEVDLKEKTEEVEELATRVDRLEDEMSDLNIELDNLRRAAENERVQREAAEADLDERNAEVEDLQLKVRDLGKQANELRQKLFEVQQENTRKVQELEQLASERDEQYQVDIAKKVERRELAEALSQQRATTIVELESQIADVEEEMRTLLAERDARIEGLEVEVANKDEEISALRVDLKSVEDLYEVEVAQNSKRREELEESITTLQITINAHEDSLERLRQEAVDATSLQAAEIEDRDTRIAELSHQIAAEEVANNDLRAEKLSLEKRVEKEAAEMLQLQAHKDEEIENLKNVIRDKQNKILIVEEKAVESDE